MILETLSEILYGLPNWVFVTVISRNKQISIIIKLTNYCSKWIKCFQAIHDFNRIVLSLTIVLLTKTISHSDCYEHSTTPRHNTHTGLFHSTSAQSLRGQGFDSQEAHSNQRVSIKHFRSNLFREGILGPKSSVNLANFLINPKLILNINVVFYLLLMLCIQILAQSLAPFCVRSLIK